MNRYLHCLFCDDVRQEMGSKFSFMGVYQHAMFFQKMPAELQKLCISFSVATLADDPIRALTFVVMKNDEVLVEHQLPSEAFMEANRPDYPTFNGKQVQTIQAFIVLPNLKINEPCVLRVRARTEREELKAPGLLILVPE